LYLKTYLQNRESEKLFPQNSEHLMLIIWLLLAVLWCPTFLNSWCMGLLQEKEKEDNCSSWQYKRRRTKENGRKAKEIRKRNTRAIYNTEMQFYSVQLLKHQADKKYKSSISKNSSGHLCQQIQEFFF